MSRQLDIGGIVVPLHATFDLQQTYQDLRARSVLRTGSGGAIVREAWSGKLATDIKGEGTLPAGLQTLNYAAAMTIKCVAPRALTQSSNVFVGVTANRRSDTDAVPYGRALVGTDWQLTTVTWGTGGDINKATLTTVSGATAYQLVYYPQISAICDPPTEEWDWQSNCSWSLHAEEA
jgi:hypothetical protein